MLGEEDIRPQAWLKIGTTFLKAGIYSNAVDAFEKVLEDEPDNVEALTGISLCHMAEGNPDAALPRLVRAKGIDEDNPEILFQLGRVYHALGEEKAAERNLKRAVELDPNLKDATTLIARIQAKPKQEAVESSGLLYEEGLQLLENGQAAEAEEPLRKAVQLDPENALAWYSLAQAYFRQREKRRKALETFRKVVELVPKVSLSNIGVILSEQGRAKEATEAFRTALRIDPDYKIARRNLARLIGGIDDGVQSGVTEAVEFFGSLKAAGEALEQAETKKKQKKKRWSF
ncbi:MAG: tetratricopeptide repeat protein [Promethearchaeota archaeon]